MITCNWKPALSVFKNLHVITLQILTENSSSVLLYTACWEYLTPVLFIFAQFPSSSEGKFKIEQIFLYIIPVLKQKTNFICMNLKLCEIDSICERVKMLSSKMMFPWKYILPYWHFVFTGSMIAHKFRITNPQDYGLYLLVNGEGLHAYLVLQCKTSQ